METLTTSTDVIRNPREDATRLEAAVEHGLQLVAAVEALAESFALGGLGDIELPPEGSSSTDQASLRAVAPLYLAAELESAGLLSAVELLAGLFASGGLRLERGPGADKLAAFWRARHERFSPAERGALFVRLFGSGIGAGLATEGGANRSFPSLFTDFTEALYQWERSTAWGPATGPHEDARVRAAARQVAANLLPRSGGLAAFAARDVLGTVQRAVEILKVPAVQSALGARTLWDTVRNAFVRYRREAPETAGHLARGQAGQLLLAWLADVLPHLTNFSRPILTPGHEAITAAASWLQASLLLEEQRERSAPPMA